MQEQSDSISDVARPGQTAATPTSKPIITGHGPMAQDPFLQPKTADPLLEEQKKDSPPNKQKSLSPSKDFKPGDDDQAATSQPVSDKAPPPTNDDDRLKQAELAKLVAEKTYFLPIGAAGKKRSSLVTTVSIGAVVVAAALVFYLMNK